MIREEHDEEEEEEEEEEKLEAPNQLGSETLGLEPPNEAHSWMSGSSNRAARPQGTG